MPARPASSFLRERSGASAVEFALVLPLMLLILLGGFALSQAVMISRKVTITTRALADLTTQYRSVMSSDIATFLNASQQIIAPFDNGPMSMRLSEVTTDSSTGTTATVTWSKSVNMSAYPKAKPYALPQAMQIPSTSYILSEVTYAYSPSPVWNAMGPYTLSDQIFMLPRVSNNVPCGDCP